MPDRPAPMTSRSTRSTGCSTDCSAPEAPTGSSAEDGWSVGVLTGFGGTATPSVRDGFFPDSAHVARVGDADVSEVARRERRRDGPLRWDSDGRRAPARAGLRVRIPVLVVPVLVHRAGSLTRHLRRPLALREPGRALVGAGMGASDAAVAEEEEDEADRQ